MLPPSVITVTVRLLYLVIVPVNSGCPSGWNRTLSTDSKIEHHGVRPHLSQEAQSRHDLMI